MGEEDAQHEGGFTEDEGTGHEVDETYSPSDAGASPGFEGSEYES
jgi:hypothetical protein